jgi:predicted outer membrane repeat protein
VGVGHLAARTREAGPVLANIPAARVRLPGHRRALRCHYCRHDGSPRAIRASSAIRPCALSSPGDIPLAPPGILAASAHRYQGGTLRRIIALPAALAAVITALGAGAAQASGAVHVPCSTTRLAAAITAANASSGEALNLAPGCTYILSSPLPAVTGVQGIAGNGATLERSHAPGTPDFSILTTGGGGISVTRLNFRNGGGSPGVDGGAIYAGNGGSVTVTGGTLTGNSAADGGAIYGANVTVTRAALTGNTATGDGGAIHVSENLQVTGGKIAGNTAGGLGGAVWVAGGLILAPAVFEITGTVIAGNTATDGGGLYDPGETLVTLTGVKVTRNHATADGGGVFGAFSSIIALNSSLVVGNTASGHGGGIAMEATRAGGFNSATAELSGTAVRRNTAADGGGIWLSGGWAWATLASSPVRGNKPDNCVPTGIVQGCTG